MVKGETGYQKYKKIEGTLYERSWQCGEKWLADYEVQEFKKKGKKAKAVNISGTWIVYMQIEHREAPRYKTIGGVKYRMDRLFSTKNLAQTHLKANKRSENSYRIVAVNHKGKTLYGLYWRNKTGRYF